jgi:drug/metabolite transporter (DMT)-like permease
VTAAVWWLVCLIWSTAALFIKIGLADLPPISFAALRLVIAVGVLAPFVVKRLIAITGLLLLAANYALLYWGAQYIASGMVVVIQAATPVFSLLFAHFISRDERFTLGKLCAIALGVAGVAVIFSDQLESGGRAAFLGAVAVAAGSVCVAFGYMVVKARARHLDPLLLMTGQMSAAAGPLLIAGAWWEGSPVDFNWTSRSIASLFYLALAGSVVAFWLNYWLLRRMSATALLAMGIVEPFFAVLLGALVLHERLQPQAFAGGALILVSVTLILRSTPR